MISLPTYLTKRDGHFFTGLKLNTFFNNYPMIEEEMHSTIRQKNENVHSFFLPFVIIICTISISNALFNNDFPYLFIENDIIDHIANESSNFLHVINRRSIDSCPLCKVNGSIPLGDSTTRDVAVCFAFKRVRSLIPFLRTFRAVSNATFVIILDVEAWKKLSEESKILIDKCGGIILTLNYVIRYSFFDDKTLYVSKINAYTTFLEKYHEYINRVLFFDLEDTFFQADPFRNDVYDSSNNITMFQEDLIVRNSPSNRRDFKKLKLPNWNIVKNSLVINGATSIGPANLMLNWMRTIDYHLTHDMVGRYDQSVFNAYGYTYGYTNLSIKFGHVITFAKSDWLKLTSKEIGSITHSNNQFNPLIGIHHTTKSQPLLEQFYKHCPRGKFNSEGYLQKLHPETINQIDNVIMNKEE